MDNTGDILIYVIAAMVVLLGVGVLRYTTGMLKAVTQTAAKSTDASGLFVALTATMIALFGILISGIFLFMSLQITNTARQSAREIAIAEVGKVAQTAAALASIAIEPELKRLRDSIERSNFADLPNQTNQVFDLSPGDQPLNIVLAVDEIAHINLVDLEIGAQYQIDAEGLGGFDSVLELFEANDDMAYDDNFLDFDDDGGDDVNSRIVFTAEETQEPGVMEEYYVKLSEWGGAAGRSTLSLRLE